MDINAKIYIAGHRGLVGSALVRNLQFRGYKNILTCAHSELDLTNQSAVEAFFAKQKPDYVFLAAAKVGGIQANNELPAQFIRDNLAIQTNIIHAAWLYGVQRLLFLGSSCIYPKLSAQPIREEYLLTGSLEETNRPYALAKLAGIELCWSYNRQYKCQYLAVMPTNLYGPGDSYHPQYSHVIPALIRKLHEAKVTGLPNVSVWGTGLPRREFIYNEDMADACLHLMNLPDEEFVPLLGQERNNGLAPVLNIGVGHDITIRELAEILSEIVGYDGKLVFDSKKPDGTPRKLLDVSRLSALGYLAKTDFRVGLAVAYQDFLSRRDI